MVDSARNFLASALDVDVVYSELMTLSEETRKVVVGALDGAAQSLRYSRRDSMHTPYQLRRKEELYRRLAQQLRDSLDRSVL